MDATIANSTHEQWGWRCEIVHLQLLLDGNPHPGMFWYGHVDILGQGQLRAVEEFAILASNHNLAAPLIEQRYKVSWFFGQSSAFLLGRCRRVRSFVPRPFPSRSVLFLFFRLLDADDFLDVDDAEQCFLVACAFGMDHCRR